MVLAAVLRAPHATPASVETEVFINEHTPGRGLRGWSRVQTTTHRLAVPPPATWTLDTVRAILATLRRFLPAHDASEATATVSVYVRGRAKNARKCAVLAVHARGWQSEAYIPSLRAISELNQPPANVFSVPMLAALEDLQARSPLALATIAPVALDHTPIDAPAIDLSGAFNDLKAILSRLPSERRRGVLKALQTLVAGLEDDSDDGDD